MNREYKMIYVKTRVIEEDPGLKKFVDETHIFDTRYGDIKASVYDPIEVTDKVIGDEECLAIDIPVLIKANNPINKETKYLVGNPTVAIVGEAPARQKRVEQSVSIGATFGQQDVLYREFPRVYDYVIDWYLERGFDVFITNFSKYRKYTKIEKDCWKHKDQVDEDPMQAVEDLQKEITWINLSDDTSVIRHIIYLGDTRDKRFLYAKVGDLIHVDCTIFPHPSGANNNSWKEILGKDMKCTAKNKADRIVRGANVLYVKENEDNLLHSSLEEFGMC